MYYSKYNKTHILNSKFKNKICLFYQLFLHIDLHFYSIFEKHLSFALPLGTHLDYTKLKTAMVTITISVSDDLAIIIIIIIIALTMIVSLVVSLGLKVLSFFAVCEYMEVHPQHRFAKPILKLAFIVIFIILIQWQTDCLLVARRYTQTTREAEIKITFIYE